MAGEPPGTAASSGAAPEGVLIRPLCRDDLSRFFDPRELALGEEWLARQERGELYVAVAEVGGVPVGRRCLDFTYCARQGAAYCFAATVLDDWQSRGIGSLLDRHFGDVAFAKGFHALQAAVAKTNVRAQSWHERLGYRAIREEVARWQDVNGERHAECWVLERPLAPKNGRE